MEIFTTENVAIATAIGLILGFIGFLLIGLAMGLGMSLASRLFPPLHRLEVDGEIDQTYDNKDKPNVS